jgi:hypothetical protein
MKKIILLLMLGLSLSVAKAQVPVVSGYSWYWKCTNYLTFTVTGPASSWVQIAPYIGPNWLGPNIYNNYNFAPGTHTIVVGPALYSIVAYNNANFLQYGGCNVNVPQRCFIKKIEVKNYDWTARSIIVGPTDPAGEMDDADQVSAVKWKVEELDPFTTEPWYSVESEDCWADFNQLGVDNNFTGFDNENNDYMSGNTHIDCNGALGYFAEDRVYRFTRSYKYYNDEDPDYWYEHGLIVGPGFSPDDDCPSCHAMQAMAISQDADATIGVFPNPSKGSFTIAIAENATTVTAEIWSMTGQLVDSFSFTGSAFSYNGPEKLSSGTYMLRVINGDKQTMQRIIIE